jgi:cell division septation protein DedD
MAHARGGRDGAGWLVTLVGVTFLVAAGFAFGLVVGIVSEEPELVVGHLAGRSEEVAWGAGEPESGEQGEAAPGEPGPAVPGERAGQPAVSSPPPFDGPAFAVQVGAFSQSRAARRLMGGLEEKGFPVYLVPSPASGDDRWRVRVGPVETRGEAERLAQRLEREESLPTWVLPEGGG